MYAVRPANIQDSVGILLELSLGTGASPGALGAERPRMVEWDPGGGW